MKTLYLTLLWHMHQPWYREGGSQESLMPWVFLHAIKDYAELPWIQSHFPGLKATYNLVPSLMVQLEAYPKGWQHDRLLNLLAKEAQSLDEKEKAALLEKGFFANPQTMIAPLWGYQALYEKRSRFESAEEAVRHFDDQELTDLAVLFLLAWCGNLLRREEPTVKSLIKKGSRFTQEEKKRLIEVLVAFCASIPKRYKEAQKMGQIAIFTTPFYHPILPLLLDLKAAKASDGQIETPKRWCDFSDDAATQVDRAASWYREQFDAPPPGFWPAEGAVSEKAMALLASRSIPYACTDEDILFKSLDGPHQRSDLYRPYRLETPEGPIGMLFRDKALSDLIGFNYASFDPQHAADDFMAKLKAIHESCDFNPLVSVFLDGENAWEFYQNNGFEFFNALYERIEKAPWCQAITVPEAFEQEQLHPRSLQSLQPGSWIYGSLSTWMGHAEKNRAWELLAMTKEAATQAAESLDTQKAEAIQEALLIAEGSDWFWWFGDDHYTPLASEFDALFRSHLRQVFHLLGKKPPKVLDEAIKQVDPQTSDLIAPSAPISPRIDGYQSSYFEWMGAGRLDLTRAFSAMDSSGAIFETLLYGTDGRHFFFQLQGNIDRLESGDYLLEIELGGRHKSQRRLKLDPKKLATAQCSDHLEAAMRSCLEIKLLDPIDDPQETPDVAFMLYRQETLIQRIPLYRALSLKMPEFNALWYI